LDAKVKNPLLVSKIFTIKVADTQDTQTDRQIHTDTSTDNKGR